MATGFSRFFFRLPVRFRRRTRLSPPVCRVLLPASLAGALLLLCADIAARLVHTNPELRLGVFTSLLGTPFFFWLVVRIRKVAP